MADEQIDFIDPAQAPDQPRNPDGTFALKAPEPTAPTHPDWLIEQAHDAGFRDADIATMTTDALGRACAVARRTEQRRLEAFRQQNAVQQTLNNATIPEPETDFIGKCKEEGVHETIIAALEGLQKRQQRELGAIRQQQQAQAQQTIAERLDAAFDALGSDYARWVGSGTAADLGVDSAEVQFRLFMIKKAGLNFNALPAVKTLTAKLKATADDLLAGKKTAEGAGVYGAAAKADLPNGPGAADWEEGGVARPTQRAGAAEPNGEAKAISNLERRMRESGQKGPKARSEIMDGFLPG